MPPMSFDDATHVRVDPDHEGRYHAEIQPGWDIRGNANGGYLIAIAGRAMAEASGRANPVTITAHYLAPGRPGPVTIDTEIVKSGKSFATVTGSMRSADGKPMLQLLGSFTDVEPNGEVLRADGAPPELPPLDECFVYEQGDDAEWPPPFFDRVDIRLHPDDVPRPDGTRSGNPLVRGWFRLHDEPLDSIALLQASDAFPPTVFNADLPIAWVPTLELTVQVRAQPAPGWLRARMVTRFVSDGLLEEDGEFWDSTGRLVALSRQLALVPRPPT